MPYRDMLARLVNENDDNDELLEEFYRLIDENTVDQEFFGGRIEIEDPDPARSRRRKKKN